MNTCDSCVFWAGPVERSEDEIERFTAKCQHPKLSDKQSDQPDGVVTFEGYGGVFTGPKFGCVHHQQRKDTAG